MNIITNLQNITMKKIKTYFDNKSREEIIQFPGIKKDITFEEKTKVNVINAKFCHFCGFQVKFNDTICPKCANSVKSGF